MTLNQSRFKQADYVRNTWAITTEEGTKAEDLLAPAYWAHVSTSLKPWDKIEVRAEDGSFYAELVVMQASRNWAKVRLINLVELNEEGPAAEKVEGHIIKWSGPHSKFRVIRESDGAVLHEGAPDKASANKWLDDHLRVVA